MGVSWALALKNREEYRGCIVRMNPGADMKCASILSLAVLLTGTCAFSQETVLRSDAKLALATPPLRMDRTNCPVGLEVKHATGLPTAISAEGPAINGKAIPYGQV